MNSKEYDKLVNELTPKPKRLKNCSSAFLIGGSVGVLGEGIKNLIEYVFDIPKEDAIIWMILIFIFLASLATAMGFFDNVINFAQAGLIIPITGFAHSITSSALDYKKDGLITGLGSNVFKLAGSVLLYGILSSFILVVIKVVIIWLT